MRISRFRKSHKYLTYFCTNFDYREPYQILIDATFCQAALQNKVIIDEQLKKYFQSQIKLITTQCIILEAESLGSKLNGATSIVKQFHVHKCGHEGKQVTATDCIKSMTKNKETRYIVASQDRKLQANLRNIPGRCLLYLHNATPVLEAPSKASKKYVAKMSKNLMPNSVQEKIQHLKKTEGLITQTFPNETKKYKGPRNPNPLSCLKSKKLKVTEQCSIEEKSKVSMKEKRKRSKIPRHVKEALQKSNNYPFIVHK